MKITFKSLFNLVLLIGLFSWCTVQAQAQTQVRSQVQSALLKNQQEAKTIDIPDDALGRRNPQGTVLGYIDAMAEGNLEQATQYLDLSYLSASKQKSEGTKLVQNLRDVLDESGVLLPDSIISSKMTGQSNDGLALNQDKVGVFKINGDSFPVILMKEQDKDGYPIWLFSSETIKKLPHKSVNNSSLSVNKVLPAFLINNELAGVPLGHWLIMLLLIIVLYFLVWGAIRILVFVICKIFHHKFKDEKYIHFLKALLLPIHIYTTAILFSVISQQIGISIIARQYVSTAIVIVTWLSILLFIWRLIDVFSYYARQKMLSNGNSGAVSAILFFRRGFKFILMATAIVTILYVIGFDVTTGLAALGIGGIMLALGAQKMVENLVGGFTVIFDQPVRLGDYCRVGDTEGTVEKIGMRSTRLRTLDRTMITIPNGDFSSQRIENFTVRDNFRFKTTIKLRYETSPDQMRYLLVELRSMLHAHPKVNPDPARSHFVSFGASSLDIEIFTYVKARNHNEFLGIKEDLNLKIMDIIDKSGSGFALPSQTIYMARDTVLSKEKTKNAEKKGREWLEKHGIS